jgi:beta-glucosidase
MKRLVTFLFLASLLFSGCAHAQTQPASPTPKAAPMLYRDASQPVEARVEDLLRRMTLDEKIGQMTQVEDQAIQPGDITRYTLGSILSGGSTLSASGTLADWTAAVDKYQKEAMATRLGIPLIYGIDAVHGLAGLSGATVFPQNVGLGATQDPALVRQIGQATAEEMLAAGIPWDFAPVVAVPQDVRWGRTYEGYSEDTALVTELGAAYIQGLQSLPPGDQAAPDQTIGVLATAKHFLGDGGTIWGSSTTVNENVRYMLDQGNTQMPEQALRSLFLPPYQAAVQSGALCVMVSFSSWNGTKMHAQRYLITNVLKDELGFQGFVVSDWGGMDQVDPQNYYDAVVTSVNAGVDMSMVPDNYTQFIQVMKQAVAAGDISNERINDAVGRILRAKFRLGLFEHPYSSSTFQDTVRSPAHIALASQAVRESLVLLKNENQALPIDKNVSTLLVAGVGASNTGLQSGGWTLGWQGTDQNTVLGTTILDGIRAEVGSTTQVIYHSGGNFDDFQGRAPYGLVVVAEAPYAEGLGDRADLSLSPDDIESIQNVRAKVDRLIVVILSGRPLVITGEYSIADAWVAAWLPGSEGAAVAGVLFGDYPFVGKSPYTWPRSDSQLPINKNTDAGLTGCSAPLFPFGYGQGGAGSLPIMPLDCPNP